MQVYENIDEGNDHDLDARRWCRREGRNLGSLGNEDEHATPARRCLNPKGLH